MWQKVGLATIIEIGVFALLFIVVSPFVGSGSGGLFAITSQSDPLALLGFLPLVVPPITAFIAVKDLRAVAIGFLILLCVLVILEPFIAPQFY